HGSVDAANDGRRTGRTTYSATSGNQSSVSLRLRRKRTGRPHCQSHGRFLVEALHRRHAARKGQGGLAATSRELKARKHIFFGAVLAPRRLELTKAARSLL